ncbi:MAG: adenylate/guanylate cyclase domain-containing protein [Sphingobium sp.]
MPASTSAREGDPRRAVDLRRTARLIGARRAAIAVLLLLGAILIARYAWDIRLVVEAERAMYDLRSFAFTPTVPTDRRIERIVYDNNTLESTQRYSPLDRGLLARALPNIDALGAKAVGIDILVDKPQPEDAALIAALRAMRTPTFVAIAREATNGGDVVEGQERYLEAFVRAVLTDRVRAASVRLEVDADGVVRNWPVPQPGDAPILVDQMSGTRTSAVPHSIRFRFPVDNPPGLYRATPIDTFEAPLLANFVRDRVAGKYVLIGGDIVGADQFDMPATRFYNQTISGLEVHASMLAQRLDGAFPPRVSAPMLWFMALLVVLAASATGSREFSIWVGGPLLVGQLTLLGGIPFALQWAGMDTQGLPAFGWIVAWIVAYTASNAAARGVGSEQRRFAQSALGKYLPPQVAKEILRDPERLKLSGERRTIYALFSDIEGFTSMTHAAQPELTASLLNSYLDRMSAIVLEHGGTIDKFVGDAVVAIWGAPIARDDDGAQALRTVVAMVDAGDAFVAEAAAVGAKVGRTRVGLHRGDAIVGNFGGDGRMQYTALGDVMNCAARLEGANKLLKTRALVSEDALAGLPDVPLRPMGRVAVRGRSSPIQVFEPVPAMAAAELGALSSALDAFEAGHADAAGQLEDLICAHPDDAALANLLYRLKSVGPGGCFALD